MAAAAILYSFGTTGPCTKAYSWCVPPVKISSWSATVSSYQVIRIWIFCRSGLKVLFTPSKFKFLGVLPPKFRGTSFRPLKGTSLRGTTRFEPSLVQIWRTVPPVALAKKTKKERKKQLQTGYSPSPPTSPYQCQSLHAVWPPVSGCIISSFIKIGSVVLPLWVFENRPFPLLWPLAYTTACTIPYKPWLLAYVSASLEWAEA